MKKRCLSLLAAVALLCSLCGVGVKASEEQAMIDGSYLTRIHRLCCTTHPWGTFDGWLF